MQATAASFHQGRLGNLQNRVAAGRLGGFAAGGSFRGVRRTGLGGGLGATASPGGGNFL